MFYMQASQEKDKQMNPADEIYIANYVKGYVDGWQEWMTRYQNGEAPVGPDAKTPGEAALEAVKHAAHSLRQARGV